MGIVCGCNRISYYTRLINQVLKNKIYKIHLQKINFSTLVKFAIELIVEYQYATVFLAMRENET